MIPFLGKAVDVMINKQEVGSRIAAIRNKLGFTQLVFSEYLGVSTQAVSKWETGLSLPDIEIMQKISWMAKCSINGILDGNEFIDTMPGIDRGIMRMQDSMNCPRCGNKLKLSGLNTGKPSFICENRHEFEVVDGVLFFNTREINGELWSLWFKNYEDYLKEQYYSELERYAEGELYYKEAMWREIDRIRPGTIVDFACGTGSGIKYIIERIRWPVTIILADLSHRVLKYDRTFFSEDCRNPYVDMVYLACDCSHVPMADKSVDMVFSNAGFESMQRKIMEGFHEAYRILKPSGHTVFTVNVVDDYKSENTSKWLKLFSNLEEDFIMNNVRDIRQWEETCQSTGYKQSKSTKIYGEMPAPEGDVFPFENNILRWMAQHIIISTK